MTIAFFAPLLAPVFFLGFDAPDERGAFFCAAVGCGAREAGALVFCVRLASNLPFFLIGMTPYLKNRNRASPGKI